MSCKQFQDALAEAALGNAQDAAMRAHLADCPACRSELDRLRTLTEAIDRSVAEAVHAEPSPGFAARVRARVAEESAGRAIWWRGWVPALAGGAAALALVAWLFWLPTEVTAPKPPQEMTAGNPSKAAEPPPSSTVPTSSIASGRSAPAEPPGKMATNHSRPARNLAPNVAPQPALPEVLVSGDEWNQVVKLYALAQRGQVNAETTAVPDTTPLAEKFQPLAIAELKPIPPLGEATPQATEPRK